MNSMVLFLIPLLGLIIWLAFFKQNVTDTKKLAPHWVTLKLRDMDIINGYEFVQCLYDFGFKFDSNLQIFNYEKNDQLWFRCLNLKKPGKFNNLEDGKTIQGLMFVTDIQAVDAIDQESCLQEMLNLAMLCQEQYSGVLYDNNGELDLQHWLETTLNNIGLTHVQEDLLST